MSGHCLLDHDVDREQQHKTRLNQHEVADYPQRYPDVLLGQVRDDDDRNQSAEHAGRIPGMQAEEIQERVEEETEHEWVEYTSVKVSDDKDPAKPNPDS